MSPFSRSLFDFSLEVNRKFFGEESMREHIHLWLVMNVRALCPRVSQWGFTERPVDTLSKGQSMGIHWKTS